MGNFVGQINSCFIAGYVGRDAEVKTTAAGPVVSFSLAYSKKAKNGGEDSTTWFRVVAFKGFTADKAAAVKKGDNIMVSGELTVRPYKGKDGSEKVDVSLVAHSLEKLMRVELPQNVAIEAAADDFANIPF